MRPGGGSGPGTGGDRDQPAAGHRQPHPTEFARLLDRLGRLERTFGEGEAALPAWLRLNQGEQRWPVGLAVLVLIGLQLVITTQLAFRPRFLLPGLELVLFFALVIANPTRITRESTALRVLGLALLVVAGLATAWSVWRLVHQLLLGLGTTSNDPRRLLVNGGAIWLANVIVFALGYWEFDRGGPAARANARRAYPDFLFPQMTAPELAHRDWTPTFVDYLYVSFTNATAFSPTDTMPMSRWAKVAMMAQSAISLVTVALVIARAVNVFR
ncbi:MAG TPA: hypothetical protein VF054_16440 [Micromonosporaceae bacterium]